MTEAFIVSTARTPIGRARKGTLVNVDAFALAEVAMQAAWERSGIEVGDVDDIVMAESLQGGGVIGRNVAVRLGMTSVPGMANNRHCAAGLTAVATAAAGIRAGMDRVVHGRRHREPEHLARQPEARRRGRVKPWMSPSQPGHPGGAGVRHATDRRGKHRPRDGPDPARRR